MPSAPGRSAAASEPSTRGAIVPLRLLMQPEAARAHGPAWCGTASQRSAAHDSTSTATSGAHATAPVAQRVWPASGTASCTSATAATIAAAASCKKAATELEAAPNRWCARRKSTR
eukprot:scaffold50924_cov69-Phaeocystis_antarctica.AAC.4